MDPYQAWRRGLISYTTFLAKRLESNIDLIAVQQLPEDAGDYRKKTTLPVIAPSLGGIETLLTRPATTSHSGLDPEERRRLGISDSLIRLSVGIEATEDIIEDFDQALRL